MHDETFKIKDLMVATDYYRKFQTALVPDKDDLNIPQSIFKYKPAIWLEDDMYFTALGGSPHEGLWALGFTPLESMKEFDKELQLRLKGDELEPITHEKHQEIHKEIFQKINQVMGW